MSNICSNKFTRVIPAPLYHIGDIAFIAYNTIPDGWMECNGSAISRTTFVELFNKIGTTYGAGDESTTFNLPDLRGEFIRGWDHGRGVDSGRALGSEQLDAFQGHKVQSDVGLYTWVPSGATEGLGGASGPGLLYSNKTSSIITDGVNGTPRTASETRPRNVALVPIIKVKNIAGSDAEVIGANADTVDGLHASDFALMLAGNNTSPIGTVILTAANAPDPGWLECDGSAISRIIYPDLFNKIGTTYGIGDGSSTFNLPDLRGEFVRGWDHGKGTDSGRILGSEQLDAFQGHFHQSAAGTGSTAGGQYTIGMQYYSLSNGTIRSPISDGMNGTPRTAPETRPRNVALMYVIKAKNIASVDPTVSYGNAKTLAGYYPKDFMLATDAIGYPFNNYLKEVGPGDYGAHFNFRGSDLIVSPFEASINKLRNFMGTPYTMTLPPRKASYVYAQDAGESTTVPIIGHYDAVYPDPDQYTVGQWIFNTTGAIGNTAVGNGMAVANNMTPSGIVTQVDGWADYGMQGDGSTGYYVSANSTGFPTAAQERELDIVFTPYKVGSAQYLACYGTSSASNYLFGCGITTSGNLAVDYNNSHTDTGYTLEIGKTYFISICYDTTTIKVFVNGVLIYTVSVSLSTQSSVLYVGRYVTDTQYSKGIIHYLELCSRVRTPRQIAAISNKLCLPCRYTGYSASYPGNDTTAGAHIYKFDDASGTTVTDENGTLNGTATGTTIVDSEIGLGKARRLNGTSDKITCGNKIWDTSYTVIFVGKLNSLNPTADELVGNYNSGDGQSILLSRGGSPKPAIWNGSSWIQCANTSFPVGVTAFFACSNNNGQAAIYVNQSTVNETIICMPNTTFNGPFMMGTLPGSSSYYAKIDYDYLVYIPRALSQAEIAQYYNVLMLQKERTLIDDCLPSNSISLGFVRTGSSALIEHNDSDYRYMRNEGATKSEGNKRVFLGWKYFSGATTLTWDNPFGTRKIRTYFTWAQDANGTNETPCMDSTYNGSYYYGIQKGSYLNNKITTLLQSPFGGVALLNTAWQTSGYIGCYAEVL